MRPLALVFLGVPLAALAAPGDELTDYAFRARVTPPAGVASHYRVVLPAGAYRGLERSDLGDLRVFNAAGEQVPYAFLPRQPESAGAGPIRPVKLFPLYGEAGENVDNMSLRVERTSSGAVVSIQDAAPGGAKARKLLLGYVVDAGKPDKPDARAEALLLDWKAGSGFTGGVRVEGSDDLKQWRTLVADAAILQLDHGGERLERRRAEMRTNWPRYLRLTFHGVPKDFTLRSAQIELAAPAAEVTRDWVRLRATEDPAKPGEFRFELDGQFPVDRLKVGLPHANTVAPVQVLVRSPKEERWRMVAAGPVYRLARESGEVTSPEIRLAVRPERQWTLRVEPRSGGLGAKQVDVELGYVAHEIVFAARGEGPFTLAYGSRLAKPAALPATTVLPGYRIEDPVPAARASLEEATGARPRTASFLTDPLAALREAQQSGEMRKWLLWIVLILGVAAIGWMASRLLREAGKPPARN